MSLAKTQFLSLVTKAITTGLGIIQSVIIIRLLSKGEFGLTGLVMSIGGVVGVSQHLGIVDGAIREIAVLKDKREVGKVFWVSHLTRQLATIPVSLILFGLAGFIAQYFYNRPEIAPYIQLFSFILILQGLQDVLGATLTGMRRFKTLYAVQIITAALNIAVFGYFIWRWHVDGFFWAIIVTTSIMVALFTAFTFVFLKGALRLPSWHDIRYYGRRVMKVGAYMYISRILFVIWQRLPILLLGGALTTDQLGDLNVSLTFGSKLTIIAAALSEVNLAWMSSLFVHEKGEFRKTVEHNMQRVFVLLLGLTFGLLFFTPEIIRYVIGVHYSEAHSLIIVMTLAFFLYALLDIGSSSLFVSADRPRLRAIIFGVMTVLSAVPIAALHWTVISPFVAALAVLGGVICAYIFLLLFARRYFQVVLLPPVLQRLLALVTLASIWLLFPQPVLLRAGVFIFLAAYCLYELKRHRLMPARLLTALEGRSGTSDQRRVICFAGATYDQHSWTNRQHMMSRVSQRYPVLYVEPRKWIVRVLIDHWKQPVFIFRFFKRLVWFEQKHDRLFTKAQCNLLPGSREIKVISRLNHSFNRLNVLLAARFLGFRGKGAVLWIYDTEAAEYLPAFQDAPVLYDCVDDHGAHAGAARNISRVQEEEAAIMKRAAVVAVTSRQLFEAKRQRHPHVELVLNAGDVALYSRPSSPEEQSTARQRFEKIPRPILGSVGALDSYKFDFALVETVARAHPHWQFVFIGAPVVEQRSRDLEALKKISNIHLLGSVPRREVPAYVQLFDVAIIPYRSNSYNNSSFPLKFWEFMATGKPVVASGLPELEHYRELIGFANSTEEFGKQIEWWLAHSNEKREERMALAQENSLEKRAEKMLRLLESL